VKLQEAIDLHQKGDIQSANKAYQAILQDKPNDFNGTHLLGLTYHQLGENQKAIELILQAISINSRYAPAYFNLGSIFQTQHEWDKALENYDQAIAIDPNYLDALLRKSQILINLNRFLDALKTFDRLVTLQPNNYLVFYQRTEVLLKLKKINEALTDYQKSIELNPNFIEGHFSLANALFDIGKFDQALHYYQRAICIDPDYDYLYGFYIQVKMKMCQWEDISDELLLFEKNLSESRWITFPFIALHLYDKPAIHQKIATSYIKKRYSNKHVAINPFALQKKKKIRVGYFSADFRIHPTSQLIVEILRCHDRTQFEVYGFSFGPENNDLTKQYITTIFDKFIDVSSMSDDEIVRLSKNFEIDIAVDLNGHTQYARTEVFLTRCAPVQINYLAYPSTIGSSHMDYIMADRVVIHEGNQEFFSEKKIYLSNCYVTHDSKNKVLENIYSRSDFDLPNNAFIFCCFNGSFKILPKTFDMWMRILKSVEGSILWLYRDNSFAVDNLLKEARFRGVNPNRLIFAERMDLDQHLPRYRLADLFLDTFPYNAHTTANDSLWAGLPVLTLMGQSFASRVASSLLQAIELPELICHTHAEYEAKAIELALNPQKLADLKKKLANNQKTTPLFNGFQITRNIELAYTSVYQRYQKGLTPEDVFVSV
jgi:predicted O-linked N-acetylglucosamine transferase (SPINDLY family)